MLQLGQLLPAIVFLEEFEIQGGAKHFIIAQNSCAQWIEWCDHAVTPSDGASCSSQLPFPSRISQYLFLSIYFIPGISSNTK